MGNLCSCLKFSRAGYMEVPNEAQSISKSQIDQKPAVYSAVASVSLESETKRKHGDNQSSNTAVKTPNPVTEYSSYAAGGSGSPSASIVIPDSTQSETKEYTSSLTTQSKSAFFAKYELRDEIGVGSTSKCYKCVRKSDGSEFACKVIDKRQVELKFSGLLDQFFVEIKVLKSLNHPNIVKLEDTFESPDRIYMVMEMMKGGELFDYVVEKGTLSEEEASSLVRKITSAVAHMHNQNIIHRDLKPENLLLTSKGPDAEVKLIDFGLAKVMRESVASSFLGTKGYLAPEMLQRQSYDKSIDMWALGVIVFVLLCGCLPFDDDSSKISSESAARKKFALRFPKWASSMSSSAKDLLYNLLEINPKTRYTADQALNHPWVSGKTVIPNSYLQSPSLMSESRREQRSPLPRGYIQDMHARVTQSGNGTFNAAPNSGSDAAGGGNNNNSSSNSVKESGGSGKKKSSQKKPTTSSSSGSGIGEMVRKNSL